MSDPAPRSAPDRHPARSSARETLEAALVAGLFLVFANTWVFRTFFIPSGSMDRGGIFRVHDREQFLEAFHCGRRGDLRVGRRCDGLRLLGIRDGRDRQRIQ